MAPAYVLRVFRPGKGPDGISIAIQVAKEVVTDPDDYPRTLHRLKTIADATPDGSLHIEARSQGRP